MVKVENSNELKFYFDELFIMNKQKYPSKRSEKAFVLFLILKFELSKVCLRKSVKICEKKGPKGDF